MNSSPYGRICEHFICHFFIYFFSNNSIQKIGSRFQIRVSRETEGFFWPKQFATFLHFSTELLVNFLDWFGFLAVPHCNEWLLSVCPLQFNLSDFTRRAYGTNYIETLRVQVRTHLIISWFCRNLVVSLVRVTLSCRGCTWFPHSNHPVLDYLS